MSEILILYYSRYGSVANLARRIADGVEEVDGMSARLRTVPALRSVADASPGQPVPNEGPPYATIDDLKSCSGLICGSPTRFGNMAAPMKAFWDSTGGAWMSGALAGKPGAVFTSTSSLHGGHESTLLSMITPLMHHGMLIVGIPFTEPALARTDSGGAPYGAGHIARKQDDTALSDDEKTLARALGRRVADIAKKLG